LLEIFKEQDLKLLLEWRNPLVDL